MLSTIVDCDGNIVISDYVNTYIENLKYGRNYFPSFYITTTYILQLNNNTTELKIIHRSMNKKQ